MCSLPANSRSNYKYYLLVGTFGRCPGSTFPTHLAFFNSLFNSIFLLRNHFFALFRELKQHNYRTELKAITLPLTPSDTKHPLLPPSPDEVKKQKKQPKQEFDPLSSIGDDPLTYGMNAQGGFDDDEDEPIVCLFPCIFKISFCYYIDLLHSKSSC